MLRSANSVIYAVQNRQGNLWELGETEDGTLLLTVDNAEAIEILKMCIEAAPDVRWRVCKYIVSGYSEELATYGRISDG